MADDLPIEESDVDFISPEVAEEMGQTVYNAKIRVMEHEDDGVIVPRLLDSSQSMAKRVTNTGKGISAKCCTPIAALGAFEFLRSRGELTNSEITNIINNSAPVLAQKIRKDAKTKRSHGEDSNEDPDYLDFPLVFEKLIETHSDLKGKKSIGGGGMNLGDISNTTLFHELWSSSDRNVAVVFSHEGHSILIIKRKGGGSCELIDPWPHDENPRSPGRRVEVHTGEALKDLLLSKYTKEGGQFSYFIFTDEPNEPTRYDNDSIIDPIVSSPPDEPTVISPNNNNKRKLGELWE
jgi:hypothetical protein